MSESIIRTANISDIEQLAALFDVYRQCYGQAPDLVIAKAFIADRLHHKDALIFVAENSDKNLIGFCQVYPSFCSVIAAKIGVLYDLYVEFSIRKTGAGRSLMLAAHKYAANNGFAR